MRAPRGTNGFGYDPLFYFAEIGKTFAELTAEEKAGYSHRGAAFRAFLAWEDESQDRHPHQDVRVDMKGPTTASRLLASTVLLTVCARICGTMSKRLARRTI